MYGVRVGWSETENRMGLSASGIPRRPHIVSPCRYRASKVSSAELSGLPTSAVLSVPAHDPARVIR